jgi:hypothetical protein
MHVHLLIDSIVRQTTVLIAQLATSGGARAPLANIANQVFLELAEELESQGVSRKVSADMFGMALRTYLRKIHRAKESSTEHGRSLWEAVLTFITQQNVASRAAIAERFYRDDEVVLRGVLHDLTESGLVFSSGSGHHALYRAATSEDLGRRVQTDPTGIDELLWAVIYRDGPLGEEGLVKRYNVEPAVIARALERLLDSGRIVREEGESSAQYRAPEFVVLRGAEVGWEGAFYDHFHAVVKNLCRWLSEFDEGVAHTAHASTYTLDVWEGHPFEEQARELIGRYRDEVSALRTRIEKYNATHAVPDSYAQVVFYAGQCVLPQD